MFLTVSQRKGISAGYFPSSTRSPINSQRILLKYSWRGYERKLRESVIIPTNFESTPRLKVPPRTKHSDDYVEWMEFRIFLVYLRQYFEYYVMFCRTDLTGDHKVDINEFKLALPTLEKWGVKIANPESEFKKIDKNGGGVIMFDEFCEYAIKKNLDLEDDDDFDDVDIKSMK